MQALAPEMTLLQALRLSRRPLEEVGSRLHAEVVCGFNPLHLPVFIQAHLRSQDPRLDVEIGVGLYGDCLGNLRKLAAGRGISAEAGCLLIEWSDLDPRLGIRRLGGWRP